MKIEAAKPLTVQLSDRQVHLDPGIPVDLPDEVVTRLLAKAPTLVLRVEASDNETLWRPGDWVEWYSEQFGPCIGQVALSVEGSWAVVVLKEPSREFGRLIWVRTQKLRLLAPSAHGTPSLGQSVSQT